MWGYTPRHECWTAAPKSILISTTEGKLSPACGVPRLPGQLCCLADFWVSTKSRYPTTLRHALVNAGQEAPQALQVFKP